MRVEGQGLRVEGLGLSVVASGLRVEGYYGEPAPRSQKELFHVADDAFEPPANKKMLE